MGQLCRGLEANTWMAQSLEIVAKQVYAKVAKGCLLKEEGN